MAHDTIRLIGDKAIRLEEAAAVLRTVTDVRFGITWTGLRVGSVWKDKNSQCRRRGKVDTASGPAIIRA